MYDQAAQSQLKEKISYELWLLDFLSKTQEIYEGGSNISMVTLINRKPSTHATMLFTEAIGSGAAMKIMDTMMPLTFIASFKILDMIIEWILEENKKSGNIQSVPRQFKEKVKIILSASARFDYPPLFQSTPYIKKYLFALYSKLLKFRHEIIHKNNFKVLLNDKLKIEITWKSKSYSIEIDRVELGAFVRTVIAMANLLTGDLFFGEQEDCLIKYHLDRINKLHGLSEFRQVKAIFISVILKVPEEKGIFPADIKFVRERISQIYPNVKTLFNLKVIGLINDKPSVCWDFPVNSIPKDEVLELRLNNYKEYLIPLEVK